MSAALSVATETTPIARRFMTLFDGLDRVFGQFVIPQNGGANAKGKIEGKATTETGRRLVLTDWEAHLNGERGLGIVPICDDGTCVFGAIDIDVYPIDHHDVAADCQELGLPLVLCRSKSGGLHCYVFVSEPVTATLLRRKLAEWAAALGHPKAEVFPKQDTISDGESGSWINMPYFAGDRSLRYAHGPDGALTPDEFLDLAEEARITAAALAAVTAPEAPTVDAGNEHGEARPREYWLSLLAGVPEGAGPAGGRDCAIASLAGKLLSDKRIALDQILPMLHEFNRELCDPPKSPADVRRIWRSVSRKASTIADRAAIAAPVDIKRYLEALGTKPDAIEDLNIEHAVILVGNKTAILYETEDDRNEPTFSLMPIASFKTWMSNRRHDLGGGKSMPLSDYWLNSPKRRQYKGLVFAPEREIPGWYNLWRGFSVEPKPGDCSLFLEHIRANVCKGDEALYRWVIGWFADIVQNPAIKPGSSLVLRGKQGVGKTIVGQTMGSLFRPHYMLVARPRLVSGNFNGHLARLLLLHADEAFWAGDHEAEGSVKDLITNDEQQIEYKYFETVRVASYVRLLVSGNHDWAVPAGMEERRFAVLDVGEQHKQDVPYFGAIKSQLDNGGREALLDHLLRFDLSAVDLRTIPKTDALFEQKVESMTPLQAWWLTMLQDGALPPCCVEKNQCSAGSLFRSYIRHANGLGDRRKRAAETAFGHFLKKQVPGLRRSKATVTYIDDRGERATAVENVYTLPSLTECRRAFSKALGQEMVWADEDAELMDVLPGDVSDGLLPYVNDEKRDWTNDGGLEERLGR